MSEVSKDLYYCKKCRKALRSENFYLSNNLEKYPDGGKMDLCKQCLTMHVDNWDPETYLWILQEIDVPYVPDEWNKLLARYGRDPTRITGTTIIGRYISKMRLKQYKDYRWADSEFLQQLQDHKIEETMMRQGYSRAEIAQTLANGAFPVPEKPDPLPPPLAPMPKRPEKQPTQPIPESEIRKPIPVPASEIEEAKAETKMEQVAEQKIKEIMETEVETENAPATPLINQEYEDSLIADLTEEDKKYLSIKWGAGYRPGEWVRLEQLYEEMMNSYDIQTAGHIDNLKLLCKTSLKANQLLDIGDVDGAQKMVKMYDALMKSGKFTAAQNKAESGEYVDSISELVAICEKDGFIPRYYIDKPQDKVDRTLQDLQNYTKTLVTEEMGLGNLIENAVKQIEIDKMKEAEGMAEAATDEELLEKELFSNEAGQKILEDEDFIEFSNFEEEQELENQKIYDELAGDK